MISKNQILDLIQDAYIFSIPLLLAQLYFKYTYLRYGGLEILERAINVSDLSLLDYLSLYTFDVIETLFVLPLILIFVGLLAYRFKFFLFSVITGLFLITGVISWTAYHVIGSFPNPSLVLDYFQTLWTDPEIVSPFSILSVGNLVKIALILLVGLMPYLFRHRLSNFYLQGMPMIFTGILLLVPIIVLASMQEQQTVFHQGNIQRMLVSMTPDSDIELPSSEGLNVESLLRTYRENAFPDVAHSSLDRNKTFIKKSKPNVIFVVLETASLDDYDIYSAENDMPYISSLIPNSLISKNHFSAYPYSIRANYSMFSSIYDLPTKDMMVDFLIDEDPLASEALPKVLSNEGYKVKYYFPIKLTQGDKERWMLEYLGFDEIWEGLDHEGAPVTNRRVKNEELMFAEAIKDISIFSERTQPFFLSLVMAIGHAPFPEIEVDGKSQHSRGEKVTALKIYIDHLIEKLVESLKYHGQLENTILVITADHGVRNKVEDPTINLAYSNNRSYNVPLLIHYPAVFNDTREIKWLSSHIDIAPTILSLMGNETSNYLYQGDSMLNPNLRERVTFFWGGHYFGTNAMHYRGKFYMENIVTGEKLVSDKFLFENYSTGRPDDSDGFDIDYLTIMENQKNIQYKWAAFLRARD